MAVSEVLAAVIAVAGTVTALVLLTRNVRGQARVLAAVGAVLVLLGVLARLAFQQVAERYLGVADTATVITSLAVVVVIGGVCTGIGLLLFTRAILVTARLPRS